ncbi:MAG: response regulator [Fimbriimonadaceae bacterium]|nr:response regulator [Fimbriimonadaceae bacterium]
METRDAFQPRILVIDDEEDFYLLLRRELVFAGYTETAHVADPRQALATFEAYRPDLVAVDLAMSYMDGFEVIRALRDRISRDEFLPILVLTGNGGQHVRTRALECGAMDYVTKSDDFTETLLRVGNLLHTRRLYCENKWQREELERRVLERTQELEDTQREILERLALAAEFRDDDTGEHTRRVGFLSEEIAKAAGLDPVYARHIGMAALLHDLGKIGVPDGILRKPGKLTAYEFENVKAHTWVGSQILGNSRVSLLRLAEEIALTHHERWDGAGYPTGLKGEEIPMSGRIVALADVFDALTHRRPYKHPWPLSRAMLEIQKQSGHQFDPNIVEAFLRLDWSKLELEDERIPEPFGERRAA